MWLQSTFGKVVHVPLWQKWPGTCSRNWSRWEEQHQHLVRLLLGCGMQALFLQFYHNTCILNVVLLYSAFLLKNQADTSLLSDCHGLARSISSTSTRLAAGSCAPKPTHKTATAAVAVTNSSHAHWLRAEEDFRTDPALIRVIHAWIMSFHFQGEAVRQAHALSVVTGKLGISWASEFVQARGSSFTPNVAGLCK